MATLRRILLQDFGTKVLALILAFAVYVHVYSGQERDMAYRVPLRLSPLPAGLSYTGEVPPEVKIRVHAEGRDLLKLRARRFYAEIKLDAPHAGTLQRPILGTDVKLPRLNRPATVEILEPRMVELTIERTVTASRPIAVRTNRKLPTDRTLGRSPRTDPATVRVTGPSSIVAAADSVPTTPINLEDVRDPIEVDARLVPPEGLTVDVEQVHVSLDIIEKRMRSTGPIKIELLRAQGVMDATSIPEFAAVLLSGPVAALDGIDLRAVRVLADAHRVNPRTHRVRLTAVVPGLQPHSNVGVQCDPESVTVQP